jgi:Ca-activated chloride channel family protein
VPAASITLAFGSPVWLLALALIPLALILLRLAQRRRQTYAVRFPAIATLRQAAGEPGSGWTRHLPAALLLAALAALAFALARPHTNYKVAVNQASIVLIIDHSGSMASTDVQPTRLAAVITAANTFIDKLPPQAKVGAIAFSTSPDQVQAPVTNHAAARQLIDNLQPSGSTATGDALALALEVLHGSNKLHPPSAIVLLSDGAANAGASPVAIARESATDHIPIFTIALGTPTGTLTVPNGPFTQQVPVPPDPELMAEIAKASGGRSFNVQDAGTLNSVYSHLGEKLGQVTRHREITSEFSILALVLLVAALGLAARLAGRLP